MGEGEIPKESHRKSTLSHHGPLRHQNFSLLGKIDFPVTCLAPITLFTASEAAGETANKARGLVFVITFKL
jgi:hypothetical protein